MGPGFLLKGDEPLECPQMGGFVEKVGKSSLRKKMRNNRIWAVDLLFRYCARSMFLAGGAHTPLQNVSRDDDAVAGSVTGQLKSKGEKLLYRLDARFMRGFVIPDVRPAFDT
jgi:hypothetical protein